MEPDFGVEKTFEEALNEFSHASPSKPQRTKLVFLYSSDEDDEGDGPRQARGQVSVQPAPVLNPPEEELRAMQDEAEAAATATASSNLGNGESEDGVCLPIPPLFIEDTCGAAVAPEATERGRTRVRVVEVPTLRGERTLRRFLHPSEAEKLTGNRKRFRMDDDDDNVIVEAEEGERGQEAVCLVAEASSVDSPRAIMDCNGLVYAVAVGGYKLTVDERQLQDDTEEIGEEEKPKEVLKGNRASEVKEHDMCDDIEHDDGYEDVHKGEVEENDEEDEEDDELDDAIVVAVVEQLVRCCESDELDEPLRENGRTFLEMANPCLQQLRDEEMNTKKFGETMRAHILRLQRAFQRLSRPKDVPIVINGVVMDM